MKKIITIVFCISLLHGMEQNSTTQKTALPNLALDLDGVILHNISPKITKKHEFFSKKSFLAKDVYNNNYIVPAYLPEFLKFATQRFNIAIFSAGLEERNKSVVEDIWLKVFNINTPENIKILCRDDLIDATGHVNLQPCTEGYWYNTQKKDIRKIGELHNTILVDDNKSWVMRDQEANLLNTIDDDFDQLYDILTPLYDEDINVIDKYMQNPLLHHWQLGHVLTYYKLLYIAGLLDIAANHEKSIIHGLQDIQFENNKQMFYDRCRELKYYKRGYSVLSQFSDGALAPHFPRIEKHFFSIT